MAQRPENTFDSAFDQVIQRRQAALADSSGSDGGPSDKVQALEAAVARRKAGVEEYSNTLVGKAGFSQNGVIGREINRTVLIGTYGLKGVGNALTAPTEAAEAELTARTTPEQQDAYQRKRERTEAERALFKEEIGFNALQEQARNTGTVNEQGGANEIMSPEAMARGRSATRREVPKTDNVLEQTREDSRFNQETVDEDNALLEQKVRSVSQHNPLYENADFMESSTRTARETLESADAVSATGESMREATDWTELADTSRSGAMMARLGEVDTDDLDTVQAAWQGLQDGEVKEAILEAAPSVSRLIQHAATTFADNPAGFIDFMAAELSEDLAVVALGRVTGIPGAGNVALTASNFSRSADAFNDGIENFRESEGRSPNAEEREYMALHAGLAMLMDQSGDLLQLGLLKRALGRGGSSPSVKEAAAGATAGVTVEGTTEGVQTYAEGEARNRSATPTSIYQGTAAGAGIGGGVASPGLGIAATKAAGRGASNLLGSRGTRTAEADSEQVAAARAAAEESGDVTGLSDPASPTYSPEAAVEVLNKRAQSPDATPEQREQSVQQTADIVSQVEKETAALKEAVDQNPATRIDVVTTVLERRKTKLAGMTEETDATEREALEASIAELEDNLRVMRDVPEAELKTDEQARKTAQAKLERSERRLNQLVESQRSLQQFVTLDTASVESRVDLADSTTETEGSQSAVTEVIRLAMESRDSLEGGQIERLASNTGNSLSDNQRSYLRSVGRTKQAELDAKTVDKVNADVFEGGKGFTGISQYRSRFANQMRSGNLDRALAQVKSIEAFADQHEKKAAVAESALTKVTGPNKTTDRLDFVYDEQDGYVPAGRKLTPKERANNRGLTVTPATAKLSKAITAESKAVRAAATELRAAYSVQDQGETTAPETQPAEAPVAAVEDVIATAQQGNTDTTTEQASTEVIADETTAPTQDAASESVTPDTPDTPAETETAPAPTELTEATQAVDESVDDSTETETLTESTEDGAQPQDVGTEAEVENETTNPAVKAVEQAETEAARSTAFDEEGREFDTETGEVVDGLTAAEQEAIQNFDPDAKGEGGLTVLASADKRVVGPLSEATYYSTNLVAAYVRQSRDNLARKATRRPLVEVKDFLSKVVNKPELAERFLAKEMTGEQKKLLDHMTGYVEAFNDTVDEQLTEWNPSKQAQFHFDMGQFLRDPETGELDENTKTAISVVAYQYLGEQSKEMTLDEAAINRRLGRQTKTEVTTEEFSLLSQVGQHEHYVINELGGRIVAALGLDVSRDTPQDILPTLTGALGSRALAMLKTENLLEVKEVSSTDIAEAAGKSEEGPEYNVRFIRVPLPSSGRNSSPVGRRVAEEIARTVSGTQGFIDKLMGAEDIRQPPSLTKIKRKFTPKRSRMGTPATLQKILEGEGAKARYVYEDAWTVWSALPKALQMSVAGAVDLGTMKVHKADVLKQQAKNEGYEREIDGLADYVNDLKSEPNGIKTPFYLDPEIWVMQRVGTKGTLVNPQASKVSRELVRLGDTEHTAYLDNHNGTLDDFYLAVAESFGVKTDGMLDEDSIIKMMGKRGPTQSESISGIYDKPEVQSGVIAIMKALNKEPLNEQDQADIDAAVKVGGENLHTMNGLIGLALMRQAGNDGKTQFTHKLSREIDGKTNGPMLGHWLLGAGATVGDLLNTTRRGGFFTDEDGVTHIGEWAQDATNQDLYQTVAKRLTEFAANKLKMNPSQQGLYEAFYSFTGDLVTEAGKVTSDARKWVKTPVTALQFGSDSGTVVADMGKAMIDAIHAKITTLANMENSTEQEASRVKLLSSLNRLLAEKGNTGSTLPRNMTVKQLLAYEIKGKQAATVRSKFENTLGKAVKDTMEDVFESILARRKPLTMAGNAAYHLYDLAYNHERQKFLNELMGINKESSLIPYRQNKERGTGKGDTNRNKLEAPKPYLDLTTEQEAVIRERVAPLLPVVHSAFSKHDNDLSAGLFLGKSQNSFDSTLAYENNAKIEGSGNVRSKGERTMNEEPGVAGLIWMIHSSDSFIAAMTYALHQGLNVHDALIVGLNEVTDTAKDLNKHTVQMLMEYSPATELVQALERTSAAFETYVAENDLGNDVDFAEKYATVLNKIARVEVGETAPVNTISMVLKAAKSHAKAANVTKIEGLRSLTDVAQYSTQGGNYSLTEADYVRIEELLGEANQQGTNESVEAVHRIEGIFTKAKAAVPTEAAEPAERAVSAEPATPGNNVADNHEDSGIDVVKQETEVPASAADMETQQVMLNELERRKQDGSATVASMISLAMKGAAPGVRVVLDKIKNTPSFSGITINLADSQGGEIGSYGVSYRQRDDATGEYAQEITVNADLLVQVAEGKARNFEGSSVAETIAEVITHELIHAVTAETIGSPSAKGNKALNTRLTRVRDDIKQWKNANADQFDSLDSGTKSAVTAMLADNQEVLTYGLTSRNVQNLMKRITSSQTSRSAWSRFVRALRGALSLGGNTDSVLSEIVNIADVYLEDASEATTDAPTIQRLQMTAPPNDPMAFTTRQIMDSLEDPTNTLSEAESADLSGLLDDLVTHLHGPYGAFKERAREAEATTPEEVFTKAYAQGKAPFVSKSRTVGLGLNAQQEFVLEQTEATIRAALEVAGKGETTRRELSSLWQQTRTKVGPEVFHEGDWSKATKEQQIAANKKRDFVFKINTENGDASDHLSRFAALAMVYPPLKEKMDFATKKADEFSRQMTLTQWLRTVFLKALEMFNGRLTRTYAGQRADDKAWALMDTLVDIESKRRFKAMSTMPAWKENVYDKVDDASKSAKKAVVNVYRSDFVRNRKSNIAKAGFAIPAIIAGERVEEMLNAVEEIRNNMLNTRQGVLASLVSESRGAYDASTQSLHKILRTISKKNEQERVRVNDMTRQGLLESFENNGKDLSKEDKTSLTRVLMDADVSVLSDNFEQSELLELMENPKALTQAIKKMEGEIHGLQSAWGDYYLSSARQLGLHMAQGSVVGHHLMLNAHNIAGLVGTKYQAKVSSADRDSAAAILDPLISLYALQKSNEQDLENVAQVMRNENARGKASGVLAALTLHKRMQEQAQQLLFDGDPTQMQKGYRAQIYNPHKEIDAFPMTDRASMEALGWVFDGKVPRDPLDPEQTPMGLFILPNGGKQRRVTGVVSYVNEAMRGSLSKQPTSKTTSAEQARVLAERAAAIDDMVKNGRHHYPEASQAASFQAPVMNEKGEAVKYRYLMKQDTKDRVLDRNNAIEQVFGVMAASTFDKVASKEQNRTAVEALKAQYDLEYTSKPRSYLRVAADSQDLDAREAYRLLPDRAKQDVKEVWGTNEMWVRIDHLDVVFGYQKKSVSNIFKKDREEREGIKGIAANFIEFLFENSYKARGYTPEQSRAMRGRAMNKVRAAEDVWQEIVTELKDILVVKTGLTLLGNFTSNVSLQKAHGVTFSEMISGHRVATEGLVNYRRDEAELTKLQLKRDIGQVADEAAADQRILELKDDLKQNPVAFMIEEGLMPTIVEDVELHDDPYSYKSRLQDKTEKWTGKVWKPMRVAGKTLYMTHDTMMYKALSEGTKMSDFVARYTLYKHLVQRKREPMSHDKAIQRASDMFINYDLPSHRTMQYLNDMGLLRFTKYYIRIQRAIFTLFREHPARMIMLSVLSNMMPGLALLSDSAALERLGNNPFENGALDYPGTLDEGMAAKMALRLFN